MKKTTLLLVFLVLSTVGSYAQCFGDFLFPSSTVASNNSGLVQSVSTCNYTNGDYSELSGLLVGEDYVFSCSISGTENYITVTDMDNNVLASGDSPLTVTDITMSDVRLHYSDAADCTGSGGCHITTMQILLACPTPLESTVDGVTTTNAHFSWTAGGSETAWEVKLQPLADPAPGQTDSGTAVTGSPDYNTTALTAAASYAFYVRANCGSEFSPWTQALEFAAACLPSVNFNENFDATSELPNCWSTILRGTTLSDYASISLSSTPVHSGPNSVSIYNSDSNTSGTDDIILVSPNLSTLSLGTYRLKFFAKGAGSFQIGTLDGNTDSANFTMLEEIATTNATAEYTVNFSGYTGTDSYIGIRMNNADTYTTIYVDDIRWELNPTCPDVTDITVTPSTTAAVVAWVPGGNETSWNVALGTETDNDPTTLTAQTAAAPTATIPGLTASTNYKVWVRSACAGNDNGAWIGPVAFTTPCAGVATLNENFDAVSTPDLPSCWSSILRGSTLSDYASVNTSSGNNVHSDPNSVALYNSSSNTTGTDDIILVSPNLSTLSLGTYRLKFFARNFGTLQIGTLDSNSDTANFTMLEEIETTNSPAEYTISFAPYTGTDTFIGIRMANQANYTTVYLDDIRWELAPTCPDVADLAVTSVTTSGASFEWTPGGAETTWNVAVGANTVTDPTTLTFQVANAATFSAIGLADATPYKVWVRSVCAGNDNGAWIGPVSFTTDCLPVAAFNQNFDSVATPALPTCWTSILRGDTLSDYASVQTNGFATVASDPNSVEMYNSSSATSAGDDIMLVSPNLSTLSLGTYRLKFFAMGQGSLQVGTVDSNTDAANFNLVQEFDTTDDAAQYVADFSAYTGTDHYIAIRMNNSDTYTSVYLDNIIWELAPSCPDVTDITFDALNTSGATVNWNPGGSETQWQVAYSTNVNADPATILNPVSVSGTATTNLTGLTDATMYAVWVRSVCPNNDYGAWIGPEMFTTLCLPSGVPFSEDFENSTPGGSPACGVVVNLGNSSNQWFVDDAPGSGFTSNTLRYSYDFSNAANTWYFTRGISLVAGTEYVVSYRYGNNATNTPPGPNGYPENLKVMMGTGTSADDMTLDIADYQGFDMGMPATDTVTFTVPASGVYYLGFNCYSDANEYYVYVDDITVDTALSTGPTPEISSFKFHPNPVKDILNISNKETITNVAVYNLLGQKVLENTNSATTATVDMSGLSAGSYLVKVSSGNSTKTFKAIKQ